MADNNNMLTIVLVVAAVLLFSGNLNLTGNAGRQVPGSQVAAWCQSPEGKLIAAGDYNAYATNNVNYIIETCSESGVLHRLLCPRTALAEGANKAVTNIQQITTNPNNYGCRDVLTTGVSNTIFPEQF